MHAFVLLVVHFPGIRSLVSGEGGVCVSVPTAVHFFSVPLVLGPKPDLSTTTPPPPMASCQHSPPPPPLYDLFLL